MADKNEAAFKFNGGMVFVQRIEGEEKYDVLCTIFYEESEIFHEIAFRDRGRHTLKEIAAHGAETDDLEYVENGFVDVCPLEAEERCIGCINCVETKDGKWVCAKLNREIYTITFAECEECVVR